MKTAKTTNVMESKEIRTSTLLGIAGWASLALGVLLLACGLVRQFGRSNKPLVATYRDSSVYVTATYGRDAGIPAGAELRAVPVSPEDDPDAYSQKMAAAMTAADRDGETAPASAIYHMGFYVGEEEIEPATPVTMTVQLLQNGFAEGDAVQVVHFGQDATKVVADTLADSSGTITFMTDSFSSFVLIWGEGGSTGTYDVPDTSAAPDTSAGMGNRITGSGRRSWTGIAMQDGGFEAPGIEEPMATADEAHFDLNELGDNEVHLTFQYRRGESGPWQNIPDDKTIFDYNDSAISITFQFDHTFSQDDLTASGGTFTYDLPPYLKDFSASASGVLYDQDNNVAGEVTVYGNRVTIQLKEDFMQKNNSANDLHFTLAGEVDLEKANKEDVGNGKYPGFDFEIPEDEREAHSKYGKLDLEKACVSDAPKKDEEGNWYLDYTLTVTAPDCDMPDVCVEDVFNLNSSDPNVKDRLKDLIEGYIKYSVDDEVSLGHEVDNTVPTEPKPDNSVYQTEENGVPKLNWYLGDMEQGKSRTLHYRVRLDKKKMETTDFKKDGTILPNGARAFSNDLEKDNADVDLSIKTHVNVSKIAQENPDQKDHDPKVYFVPDGTGGGYIEYKVTVKNDKDYPVNVKVYDSVNEPHANTTNNDKQDKGKGLSYVKESFKYTDEKGDPLDPQPDFNLDFSTKGENDASYTSFTAHIGWLEPQQEVYFTYRIHVDAETLATGTVDVNNGVLALFEGQETTDDTYPTWLERYQQNHTVEQESWAAKNYGGRVEPQTIEIPNTDAVYDATSKPVTVMGERPDSFDLGENSFKYTVTVNGNTVWDVSSATMGDRLAEGLRYSGYVKVVAKDKNGTALKTTWVKVDDLQSFSFTGDDIGFDEYGAGTSYELTYYTTVDTNNKNFYFVLENDFTMTGDVYGPGGDGGKIIHVNVQDSTTNRAETSNHLEVTKDAWYYEPDASGQLGAFYWVVKVDASYIPSGFALKDVAGEKHELRTDSLLGVYTGPDYSFGKDMDWAAFQSSAAANKFKIFNQYSSRFDEGDGLTVTFTSDYSPDVDDKYVYLFFKTYVTERQADPYENAIYSNGDNIPDTTVDHLEDEATNTLPNVGSVEKAGVQIFDWDGSSTLTMLNNNNPGDYQLNADILSDGDVPAGRYAAWSVSVNKTGTMQGDFTITDQIPEGMELSFVAIAKTVNILQPNTNNTPPWAIPLEDKNGGKSGLLVGHAMANQNAYTTGDVYRNNWSSKEAWQPWTADNWKYYPDADGRTVSWGVHIENGMCIRNRTQEPISAYEVDYLVVCRVTDPDVLLGVTSGDPQKTFNNHVTVHDGEDNSVANADAALTVPCKPVLTKEGIQDQTADGHRQQIIKFTLKVNEAGITVEGVGDTLTLEDTMSEKLLLVPDSVHFYAAPGGQLEMTKGVSYTTLGNVITFTIPNGKPVYIQYECEINARAGTDTPVENTVNFKGHQPDDEDDTWQQTVSYDITAGISGAKVLQFTKKDSVSGEKLPGAAFEVKLLGTTDDSGAFVPIEGGQLVEPTKDESGAVYSFEPVEGGLYEIVETQAPEGYIKDPTPRYYWIGKKQFDPPTAAQAHLPDGTVINEMYTGKINIDILNERAKITVKKNFVNADGEELTNGVAGTYTFGLFTKGENGFEPADEVYGNWKQTLTYPQDKDKGLTFYVPYNSADSVQYYILELDKDGNPIEPRSGSWIQTADLGTAMFEPDYDYEGGNNNDAASSEDAETTVTVTNTYYAAYELPESGGPGTLAWFVTGLVLMLGSGIALNGRERRRRVRQTNRSF